MGLRYLKVLQNLYPFRYIDRVGKIKIGEFFILTVKLPLNSF